MALPGDATDLTSFTELVPSEYILNTVFPANLRPTVGTSISWAFMVPEGTGSSVAIPQFQSWSPSAGTKTEGAAFGRTEMTTTENTASAGVVGEGVFVSRELSHDQILRSFDAMAANAIAGIMIRKDTDLLAEIANATNTSDHGDVAMTNDLLMDDIATFMGQSPTDTGRVALVFSEIQFRDWKKSIHQSSAANFGSDARSTELRATLGPRAGFKGFWEDMEVYVSTGVANASSKDSGAILAAGEMGAIVDAVWDPLRVVPEDKPENYGVDYWFSTRYATAVSVQSNMLEIMSSDD